LVLGFLQRIDGHNPQRLAIGEFSEDVESCDHACDLQIGVDADIYSR
jgi:hypothetical protein